VALLLDELALLETAAHRTGLYILDAYMVRYHPQWDWLRGLDIGERRQLNVHFSYPPQPDGNIRNKAAWGGGPIWDIGCYCVLSGLMLFEGTPELIAVVKQKEETLDVEKSASAIIAFTPEGGGDQKILNLSCSSGMALSQSLHLIGSDGWARLDVPFNPPEVTSGRFALQEKGTRNKDGLLGLGQQVDFAPCDQYALMVADFAKAVEEGRQADLSQSSQLTRLLSQMINA
jgi:predicted dehydrogenase